MADDIFISYKSERRKAAEHLAAVLRLHGWSVWFDYQLVKGSDFGFQIDRRIREAKAVVVLWCVRSVGSRWVAEEADLAYELGILVPAMIEPCNLRVGFRCQDYTDLSSWDGSPRSHQLDPLIDALTERIGRPPQIDYAGMRAFEAAWRHYGAQSLRQFALGEPAAEDGRHLPPAGSGSGAAASPLPAAPAAVNNGHELMALAAREWPEVRDSADPQRLERFARHFAETYYAEEARVQLDKIEADGRRKREAEQKRQAEEQRVQKLRAEGRIQVLVGDRDHSETRWLKPGGGEPFRDVDGGPEMVAVPAGSFMMGSPTNEPERSDAEGPQHKVTIGKPFAVGKLQVTVDQFAAFVGETGYEASSNIWTWEDGKWGRRVGRSWRNPGFVQDGSHPVVGMSWGDAKAYADWLTKKTGKPYRLLSEAEWEYAARAGTTTPFWWGSSITSAQANYNGNYVYAGGGSKGEYRGRTTPAGSFVANPWGLCDVHGNAWEWTEDCWHDNYNSAPSDGSPWITSRISSDRVVRGGSWYNSPRDLRAACRVRIIVPYSNFGFRLARTLTS